MARDKLIQLRRGLASEWTSVNPILASGESGLETDTNKIKIGNNINTWNTLPYFNDLTNLVPITRTINGKNLSANVTLNSLDVGLGNVTNLDTSTTSNITDSLNKRFVTDALLSDITHSNRTALDLVTNTNTGDETNSTIKTKLGTDLSNKLEYNGNGSSLTGLTKTQVGLNNVDNISLQNIMNVTKEPTGFDTPENVIVTYSQIDRTVTLTGTFSAYYKGSLVSSLISGWVSDPHPSDKTVNQWLSYDGISFNWTDIFPGFDVVSIACIVYHDTTIGFRGTRECHGLMPWQSHKSEHLSNGTIFISGGTSSGVTIGSQIAAQRRPDISSTTLLDEDLQTVIPPLTSKTYTQHYLSGTSTTPVPNTILNNTDIVPLLSNRPYYNRLNAGTWQQTLMSTNGYMSVYVIAIPATSDTESQAVRYIFVQGQSQNVGGNSAANTTALNAQLSLDPSLLNITNLNSIAPEIRIIWQYVIKYDGTLWTVEGQQQITGTKNRPVAVTGTTGITTVEHDTTLSGSGTLIDPLKVEGVNTKDGGTKFDWVGTLADYNAGRADLSILDSWVCYITDDYGVIDADSINDTTTLKKLVSSAEKTAITHTNRTALDNVSGVNTGNETASTIKTALGTSNPLSQVLMRVKLTSNQTINVDSLTKVGFNSVDFDTHSIWDNTNKWATIPRTGYYQISACIGLTYTSGMGYMSIGLSDQVNNFASLIGGAPMAVAPLSAASSIMYHDVVYITQSTTISINAFTKSVAIPITGSSTQGITYFTIKEL